jgi:hypothetical protein
MNNCRNEYLNKRERVKEEKSTRRWVEKGGGGEKNLAITNLKLPF